MARILTMSTPSSIRGRQLADDDNELAGDDDEPVLRGKSPTPPAHRGRGRTRKQQHVPQNDDDDESVLRGKSPTPPAERGCTGDLGPPLNGSDAETSESSEPSGSESSVLSVCQVNIGTETAPFLSPTLHSMIFAMFVLTVCLSFGVVDHFNPSNATGLLKRLSLARSQLLANETVLDTLADALGEELSSVGMLLDCGPEVPPLLSMRSFVNLLQCNYPSYSMATYTSLPSYPLPYTSNS